LRHSFYLFLFLNSLKRAHSAGFTFFGGLPARCCFFCSKKYFA
jgi:hypothetical protein